MRKDVVNLTDGKHVKAVVLQLIQHGGACWFKREVMAARSACIGPLTLKRTGDYASNAMLALKNLARNATILIERLNGNNILVSSNLKYGIG